MTKRLLVTAHTSTGPTCTWERTHLLHRYPRTTRLGSPHCRGKGAEFVHERLPMRVTRYSPTSHSSRTVLKDSEGLQWHPSFLEKRGAISRNKVPIWISLCKCAETGGRVAQSWKQSTKCQVKLTVWSPFTLLWCHGCHVQALGAGKCHYHAAGAGTDDWPTVTIADHGLRGHRLTRSYCELLTKPNPRYWTPPLKAFRHGFRSTIENRRDLWFEVGKDIQDDVERLSMVTRSKGAHVQADQSWYWNKPKSSVQHFYSEISSTFSLSRNEFARICLTAVLWLKDKQMQISTFVSHRHKQKLMCACGIVGRHPLRQKNGLKHTFTVAREPSQVISLYTNTPTHCLHFSECWTFGMKFRINSTETKIKFGIKYARTSFT